MSDRALFAWHHQLGDQPVPAVVLERALGRDVEFVWRNQLGGLTFRIGDEFIKWSPRDGGVDLELERVRLEWIVGRHPAPEVIASGSDGDGQWLVTSALAGESAIAGRWRDQPSAAIQAIAAGLRAMHAVAIDDFPDAWTGQVWVGRTPATLGARPPIDEPVLVHGDACAPNTLIGDSGSWTGNVDLGDLAVGDRWADLAVASMSLDWNFGAGHQDEFFAAYGIEPDPARIRYYRALWNLES